MRPSRPNRPVAGQTGTACFLGRIEPSQGFVPSQPDLHWDGWDGWDGYPSRGSAVHASRLSSHETVSSRQSRDDRVVIRLQAWARRSAAATGFVALPSNLTDYVPLASQVDR